MKCPRIAFCFYALFSTITLHGLQKGSQTVVSIESLPTFPAADSDNKLIGFGWFRNGFGLEDATTSCTFESIFPVSGNINFNGGILYLNEDLKLDNTMSITSFGEDNVQSHFLDMCESITFWGAVLGRASGKDIAGSAHASGPLHYKLL